MTYNDVINRFKSVANAHYMIKDFGYGQLSDIKVHSEDGEADYPYMFLNPGVHTREGINMEYNFNMIMMDIAIDEDNKFANWPQIQSQCQQYIDDVIAELYYGYTDSPIIDYTNVTYTPFKERFQDSLAGMTANIKIVVPTPINQCIAPIAPLVPPLPPDPEGELQLQVSSNLDQSFPVDTGQSPWRAQVVTLDTQSGWRPPTASNFYTPTVSGTWNFVMTGTGVATVDRNEWPNAPITQVRRSGQLPENVVPTTSNWPAVQPPIGEQFTFRIEWTSIQKNADGEFMAWNWIDVPGVTEDTFVIESGTELKGFFTPTI